MGHPEMGPDYAPERTQRARLSNQSLMSVGESESLPASDPLAKDVCQMPS